MVGVYIALFEQIAAVVPEGFAGVTIAAGLFAILGLYVAVVENTARILQALGVRRLAILPSSRFAVLRPPPLRLPQIDWIALLALGPVYVALVVFVIVCLSLWLKHAP